MFAAPDKEKAAGGAAALVTAVEDARFGGEISVSSPSPSQASPRLVADLNPPEVPISEAVDNHPTTDIAFWSVAICVRTIAITTPVRGS